MKVLVIITLKAKLRNGQVLGFVNHGEVEGHIFVGLVERTVTEITENAIEELLGAVAGLARVKGVCFARGR